ncbi:MAG: hypothetical protein LBU12_08675 [Deltaproteobacteria bacterium]|jgi:DNA polymerase|nr:hypothetical protein [Deltaproteobacteria bacterium]
MDCMKKYVVVDFETYYDNDYSLKKLSYEEYVNHPKFRAHCVGIKSVGAKPSCSGVYNLTDPDAFQFIKENLTELNKQGFWFVAHNMMFDGYIMRQLFDLRLKRPVCTMALARWTGVARSHGQSLALLAQALKLPSKGAFLEVMVGKKLEDLTEQQFNDYLSYCLNDVELTAAIYDRLTRQLTPAAQDFIALSLRMYVDPILQLDETLLVQYMDEKRAEQELARESLQRCFNFPDAESFLKALRSAAKFSGLLRELGVEPPLKDSAAKIKARQAALAWVACLSGFSRGFLKPRSSGVKEALTSSQKFSFLNHAPYLQVLTIH